jgi:uncharacterized protein
VSYYFFDTSALHKRYVVETGSGWSRRVLSKSGGNTIFVSELARIEVVSALSRLHRESRMTVQRYRRATALLYWHLDRSYAVVDVRPMIIADAVDLVARYPLRTLDAIQLASALNAQQAMGQPLIFVSADKQLLKAAVAKGFQTEDPNLHP